MGGVAAETRLFPQVIDQAIDTNYSAAGEAAKLTSKRRSRSRC